MDNSQLTLKNLLSALVADIDIFLLKEEDQITDKTTSFTVDEVRTQLETSVYNVCSALERMGVNIDAELKRSFLTVNNSEK